MPEDAAQRKSDQKWEVPNPGLPKVERDERLPKAGAKDSGGGEIKEGER
jgi:hypothetical protein